VNREQRRAARPSKKTLRMMGDPGPPIVGPNGEDLRMFAAKIAVACQLAAKEDERRR
jgi:hypothetical protein